MSSWPLTSDFARLLKTPKAAFRDPALKQCAIEMNQLGQPKPRSGNFATVYKAFRPDGGELAVRVFNRRGDYRRERYRQVSEYLEGRTLHSLVHFEYDEKGIRSASDSQFYPLVTMQWVPGVTLFDWARDRCREGWQEALTIAADVWLQVTRELAANDIVHGDLQHGNVLVSQEGYFKLVDYDCLAVPSLLGQANMEVGLEPYQHPGRNADTQLFAGLDNFSALVIYVALRALAAAPHLWITYVDNTGYDKLLFRKEDFANPAASRLYHDLMSSPDEQVRDLTHYLFQLVHYELTQVPPVDEVLLWCNSLDDLLAARDWDMAIQLVKRMGPQEQIAPHLQHQVDAARRRVACREALAAAIARGDEMEIQRCYVPELLDDYPAAAQLVEQARVAGHVVQVLEVLRAAREYKNWDVFRRTWVANQHILTGRKSAAPYREEVKRLIAADTVRKLLLDTAADDQGVVEAWKYLQSLGGHPSAAPLESEMQTRINRRKVYVQLKGLLDRAPNPPKLSHDRQFVSMWEGKLFDGQAGYQPLRQHHRSAVARLKRLRTFLEQAAKSTPEGERSIASLATELPQDYHPQLKPRCELAIRRTKALARLEQALAEPASDREILKSYKLLVQVDGKALASEAQRQRVKLASKRRPLLAELEKLSRDWPPSQLDEKILAVWDEQLLGDCADAAGWKPAYQRAKERQVVLRNLAESVEVGDLAAVEQLKAEPCLRGYSLPDELIAKIEEARGRHERKLLARRQAMVTALLENDRKAFVEFFDIALLKDICRQYVHHQAVVVRLMEQEILPLKNSGLSLGEAGGLEKVSDAEYVARWQWPPAKIAAECRLAVCSAPPKPHASPEDAPAVYRVAISRSQWQVDGNCHRIEIVPEWSECHVVVWFSIDLGFQTFHSEPLVVGQIEAAKKQKRWGLFG